MLDVHAEVKLGMRVRRPIGDAHAQANRRIRKGARAGQKMRTRRPNRDAQAKSRK